MPTRSSSRCTYRDVRRTLPAETVFGITKLALAGLTTTLARELCGGLLLFCAPAGAWITGQVLNIDGGFVMRP